jgi:hypothetical protein
MTSFDGFDDLAEQLRVFQQQLENGERLVDDALDSAVETTAAGVERRTKQNLTKHGAVDTGNLRNSYRYARVDTAHYMVGTSVEYGPHVEFGTDAHVIEADDGGFLYFEGEDGQLIRKRSVNHPGTPAQPHLRPALRNSDLAQEIQEEIEELFEKVFQ